MKTIEKKERKGKADKRLKVAMNLIKGHDNIGSRITPIGLMLVVKWGGWGLDFELTFTSETIDTVSALRTLNIANAAPFQGPGIFSGQPESGRRLGYGKRRGQSCLLYRTCFTGPQRFPTRSHQLQSLRYENPED